jgi:hypothetical protein
MKIYIDKNLVPRYSQNGWPEVPQRLDYMDHAPYLSACESYNRNLEKAKADSVPFLTINGFLHESINPDSMKPDTFMECEIGEVEIGYQWMSHDGKWVDVGPGEFKGRTANGYRTRTVARLKLAESEIGFEMVNKHGGPTGIELVEKYKLDAANKRIKELEDFIADLYETVDAKEIKNKLHEFLTD